MRVLLVDAQLLFGDGLSALLSTQPGFQVLGRACTAAEAVKMASDLKPDVVLIDAHLPDGSGTDVTKLILRALPAACVVFLTIHDEDEFVFPALRAGARGYLLKNTSLPQLVDYLHKVERGEPVFSPSIMARLVDAFARVPLVRPQTHDTAELTTREVEVLRALSTGATNREIGLRLAITENTVKNHVRNILAKLNLHSRHEAKAFAEREFS
jgi:two-component system NarL family response regulator